MTVQLPFSPLPGADHSGSLAEAVQANLDALAMTVITNTPFEAGAFNMTWPGGSSFVGPVTVTHTLGVQPRAIVLTVNGATSTATFLVGTDLSWGWVGGVPDTTQFTVFAGRPDVPTAGTTFTVNWVAFA